MLVAYTAQWTAIVVLLVAWYFPTPSRSVLAKQTGSFREVHAVSRFAC
jgi:hypothetical protein